VAASGSARRGGDRGGRPWWLTPGYRLILNTLEDIMSELDDIKAEQAQTREHVVAIQTGVDRVQADFQILLDRLANLPQQPGLAEVLEASRAVNADLAALRGDVEGTPGVPPTA
jgi:hypothetical protein